MSAMSCTLPVALRNRTLPPQPTPTITRFGAVWPRARFRLLTTGGCVDASDGVGYTRTSVNVVALVPVTFRTTAVASAGIETLPPRAVGTAPVTCTSIGEPAETGPPETPTGPS